jgi:hypothetical protein
MYQVLTDTDLRVDLRERGLKWVRAFSWRRTAEQMCRLLDEVQAGTGAGAAGLSAEARPHRERQSAEVSAPRMI